MHIKGNVLDFADEFSHKKGSFGYFWYFLKHTKPDDFQTDQMPIVNLITKAFIHSTK
jgi:hypothetical protein